tara:strand:+ start:49 stop:348 length:300 start_codon:yes stop_codon:yes gene_type:complete
MSNNTKKWEELSEDEEERQRIVAQNGPSALHYNDNDDEDIDVAPTKDVKSGCPSHHVEDEVEERWVYNMTFENGLFTTKGFFKVVNRDTSTGVKVEYKP